MQLCFANTAEWIEVLLGMETLESPRHIVLNSDSDPTTGKGWGKILHFVQYTNTAFPTHSPDVTTSDASSVELL